MTPSSPGTGLLQRIQSAPRSQVTLTIDGRPCHALEGDTVLTAILTQGTRLRCADATGEPRAGFCLMGACQDCWVMMADGRRVRACTTLVQPDMELRTGATP